ncbi:MAG TPA: NAD(P)-dependent oxidoreductase [Polyangiaceae bacterium]|nr:NAD(P)-dependent oxidoreductase [Polyangiaceae bacterium]
MRVFLTGATGFIGRHLCQRLVERGDQVVALVRSQRKAAGLPREVQLLQGDLSVFANPRTELPESEVVIHLAGVVTADKAADYQAINYAAVKELLDCIGRQPWKPRRLLFASSLAAGGPTRGAIELDESEPCRPIDPYGEAKARAETIVREAPFPTTAFRPSIVLGPGDEASLTLFRAARTGIGFRVAGEPQALSFVDVRDLVDAIVCMATDRRPGSFCYYASHPARTNVRELWRELARSLGRRVLVVPVPAWLLYALMRVSTAAAAVFRFRNRLDAKQYAQMTAPAFLCSSARLRAELGWAPKHDLADCIANAAHGYRAAGALRPG